MAFSESWLDELLAKNDIAQVISAYTELRPKGGRLWGLCPLHGEKTPSFSVSPDKQMFYCFGCHAGGTVIQFLMQMEHLSYFEAIQKLAERVGMELPDRVDDDKFRKERSERERILDALRRAARYYCERFYAPEGETARAYAAQRGLTKEAVSRFGIGWAPSGWDGIMKHLTDAGFTKDELTKAGLLVHNRDKDSYYDTYRGRLIFPICGADGKVLGFGARVLDDSTPKYINTGDTPVYNKRNNLYGLYLHKRAACPDIVMVEGYMDVIGLYKAGITNVVASLGTALTQQQAQLLKNWHVETVYIAYDGDAAGQNAMLRGMDILAAKDLKVRVIRFPDGLDPDEYVQVYGSEGFNRLKENAITHNEFALLTMAKDMDFDKADDRERYARKACAYIATLQPVERDRYFSIVSQTSGYSVEVLRQQSGSVSVEAAVSANPKYSMGGIRRRAKGQDDARLIAERALVKAAISDADAYRAARELQVEDKLRDKVMSQIYAELIQVGRPKFKLSDYIRQLEADEADAASSLLRADDVETDAVRTVRDCAERIDELNKAERMEALSAALADSSISSQEKIKMMNEIQRLSKAKK
ncbi:MAG TPA: DNA primase [Eubacteriales bacterium]|nr:DNA primase [Clostridia bacterium]HRV72526.1 DNA primase [Eubacteriales bacterium]